MNKRHFSNNPKKAASLPRRSRTTLPAPGHQPRRSQGVDVRRPHNSPRDTKPYSHSGVHDVSQVMIPKNPPPKLSPEELANAQVDIITTTDSHRVALKKVVGGKKLSEDIADILTNALSSSTTSTAPLSEEPTVLVPIHLQNPPRKDASVIIDDPELDRIVSNPEAGKILNVSDAFGRNTLESVGVFHTAQRQKEIAAQKKLKEDAEKEVARKAEEKIDNLASAWFHSAPEQAPDVQEEMFQNAYRTYVVELPDIIAKTTYVGDREHLESALKMLKASDNATTLADAVSLLINFPYQRETYLKIDALVKQVRQENNKITPTVTQDSNNRIFEEFKEILPSNISALGHKSNATASELQCEIEVNGQKFILEFNVYKKIITDVYFPHNIENTPVLTKFIGQKLDRKVLTNLETTLVKISQNPDGYISKEPPAPEAVILLQKAQKIATDFQNRFNATKTNPDAWLFIESAVENGKVIVTASVGEVSEKFEVFESTKKSWFRTVQELRIHSDNDALSSHAFDKNTLQKVLDGLRKDRESFIPPAPKVSFTDKVKASFNSLWSKVKGITSTEPTVFARAQNWLGEKWNQVTSLFSKKSTTTEKEAVDPFGDTIKFVIPPQKKRSTVKNNWVRRTAWVGVFLGLMSVSNSTRRESHSASETPSVSHTPDTNARTIHTSHTADSTPTVQTQPTVVTTPEAAPSVSTESFSMAEAHVARRGREGTMIDFLRRHGIDHDGSLNRAGRIAHLFEMNHVSPLTSQFRRLQGISLPRDVITIRVEGDNIIMESRRYRDRTHTGDPVSIATASATLSQVAAWGRMDESALRAAFSR